MVSQNRNLFVWRYLPPNKKSFLRVLCVSAVKMLFWTTMSLATTIGISALKKYILKPLKFIAFLSLGLLFLWLAFRGVEWNEFLTCFIKINYLWIALPLPLLWLGVLFRAWRWKILIKPLGYNVSLFSCYHAVSIAYLANFVFPRIGEMTRCVIVNRSDKVPFQSLIGTVITERISDLLMLSILTIAVFFIKIDFFGLFITHSIFLPLFDRLTGSLQSLWAIGLMAGLLIIAFAAFVFLFRHRTKEIAMFQTIGGIAKGVLQGITSILHMKKKLEFLVLTLLIWIVCYWLMTWIPVLAMPATRHLDLMDGLFLLVIAGLAFAAPVQGGIGVFHAMITLALTTLYGISREEALAFAILLHESQVIFFIIVGGLSFLILSLQKKKGRPG